MADQPPLEDLVKKDLLSGKDPDLIIQELKASGYSDDDIIHIMEDAAKAIAPEEPKEETPFGPVPKKQTPKVEASPDEMITAAPVQMPPSNFGGGGAANFSPMPFDDDEDQPESSNTMMYGAIALVLLLIVGGYFLFFSGHNTADETTSADDTSSYSESIVIGELDGGENITMELDNADTIEIDKIQFVAAGDGPSEDAEIDVTKLDDMPSDINAPTSNDSEVYAVYDFDTTDIDDTNMNYTKIYFSVDKSWLKDNGFDKDTVKMWHYNDDSEEWEALSTKKEEVMTEKVYYSATTKNFSYFAVTATSALQHHLQQDINASTTYCGSNYSCFLQNAKTCSLLKATLSLTPKIGDTSVPGRYSFKITGQTNNYCYMKVKLLLVTGYDPKAKMKQGETMDCEVPLDDMSLLSDSNIFDLNVGNDYCTGDLAKIPQESSTTNNTTTSNTTTSNATTTTSNETTTPVNAESTTFVKITDEKLGNFTFVSYSETTNTTNINTAHVTLMGTAKYSTTRGYYYVSLYKYNSTYYNSEYGVIDDAFNSAFGGTKTTIGSNTVLERSETDDYDVTIYHYAWDSDDIVVDVNGANDTIAKQLAIQYLGKYASTYTKKHKPAENIDNNELQLGTDLSKNRMGYWGEEARLDGTLTGVDFITPQIGYIIGYNDTYGLLFKTSDGGKTWATMRIKDSIKPVAVSFANELTGWVVTDYKIFKTTNGGSTWIEQSNIIGNGVRQELKNNKKLRDIKAQSTSDAWAVGGSDVILHTSNGGSTWEWEYRGATIVSDVAWKSVDPIASNEAWLGGNHGVVHVKINSTGSPKFDKKNDTLGNILRIDYVKGNYLFALSSAVTFENAKGGGWKAAKHNTNNARAMDFVNTENGWIAGDSGEGQLGNLSIYYCKNSSGNTIASVFAPIGVTDGDPQPNLANGDIWNATEACQEVNDTSTSASGESKGNVPSVPLAYTINGAWPICTDKCAYDYYAWYVDGRTNNAVEDNTLFFDTNNVNITDLDMLADSQQDIYGWAITSDSRVLEYGTRSNIISFDTNNHGSLTYINGTKLPAKDNVSIALVLEYENESGDKHDVNVSITKYVSEDASRAVFNDTVDTDTNYVDVQTTGDKYIRRAGNVITWRSGVYIIRLNGFALDNNREFADNYNEVSPIENTYLSYYPTSLGENTNKIVLLDCISYPEARLRIMNPFKQQLTTSDNVWVNDSTGYENTYIISNIATNNDGSENISFSKTGEIPAFWTAGDTVFNISAGSNALTDIIFDGNCKERSGSKHFEILSANSSAKTLKIKAIDFTIYGNSSSTECEGDILVKYNIYLSSQTESKNNICFNKKISRGQTKTVSPLAFTSRGYSTVSTFSAGHISMCVFGKKSKDVMACAKGVVS